MDDKKKTISWNSRKKRYVISEKGKKGIQKNLKEPPKDLSDFNVKCDLNSHKMGDLDELSEWEKNNYKVNRVDEDQEKDSTKGGKKVDSLGNKSSFFSVIFGD